MAEFPIVGIGSSAGGLEALQQLFRKMPPDGGLAFIVAAHLDPTQKSHLAELLGRCTKMPVVQIQNSMKVEPDHVYVIAPDQELTIREGIVRTNKPRAPRGHRHPVDSFFRSLAEDQGERAIAIVLSGTGTNGSLGLRFIKAEGGIALAQDPETAAFAGMPRSAIGTGVIDLVLPPDKMPDALLSVARHLYVRQPAERIVEQTPDEQLRALLTLVRSNTGRDFSSYRKQTLLRRIHRRMGLHRIEDLGGYIERLRNDPEEIAALAGDLTINVTGFFRDPDAWKALDQKVIAPLVQERPTGSTIRVWVPGCSTGEEAYSIAILVTERAEAAKKTFDLRLFATDVAQGVLSSARAGLYPASIAQDVTPERLERWFEMDEDAYIIRKTLREAITFAPQNILQDPPFSRLDLVSCRNLLIYIEPDVQKRLLGLFHFALREGGHLFLGPAESIGDHGDLFEPVSRKWRIYGRIGPTRHDVVEFPLVGKGDLLTGADRDTAPVQTQPRVHARELVEQAVLARYAPACALIDRGCRVHYLRGPTGDYLQPPSGEPSYNLIAMAREGLQTTLRRAVREAINDDREVTADARVRLGGSLHPVRVVVAPLRSGHNPEPRLLVSFFEREIKPEADVSVGTEGGATEGQLQAELDAAREDLRLTIEQMEASNEELMASNEEIRSINEELQASNEELETSKEELQSLNEELNTVNNQLQAKVAELERRTDDLNNLLNSTDVLTLFLDRSLCIRWFTPSMKALLELRPTDIGRPVSHFAQRFRGSDLLEDARQVLERLRPADAEVVDDLGRWYIRHIVPYRTANDRIDGVVVTFVDITESKKSEKEVQGAREFAESIVDTVREPLLVLTPELKVRSANDSFYRDFQVNREETENQPLYELGDGQWDIPELRRLLEEVLPHDKQFSDFKVEHEFEGIGRRTMLLNGRRLDHVQLILLAIEDITERRRAEAALADELQAMIRLHELSTRVVRAADLQTLLDEILDSSIELQSADFGNVQLYDDETKRLRIAAQHGFHERFLDHFAEVDAKEGSACGFALARGERMMIEDVEKDPAYTPSLEEAREAGYRAVQSTPLLTSSGKLVGMLSTHFREPHRFAERELRLTDVYARQVADAIAAQLLQDSLRASEERLREVLETDAVGVIFLGKDGTLTDANEAFLRMTGYSRRQVQGRELTWRKLTPPEWIEESEVWFKKLEQTGRIGPYEKEYFLKDRSRAWMLFVGRRLGDGTIVEYCIDISDRKRVEAERELLARELSHRVKNTLAVVQALAMQTNGRIDSVEAYRQTFVGRLQALARAHSLLLDANWQGADLKTLVDQTIAAYRVDHPQVIEVEGEPVAITPKQGLGLSLVLHELGTNAAKYGALSQHEGRVRVSWQVEHESPTRRVRLRWQERHGPVVEPPGEKGFGTQLIERAATFELEGEVELNYAPEGLTCEVVFPLQ